MYAGYPHLPILDSRLVIVAIFDLRTASTHHQLTGISDRRLPIADCRWPVAGFIAIYVRNNCDNHNKCESYFGVADNR